MNLSSLFGGSPGSTPDLSFFRDDDYLYNQNNDKNRMVNQSWRQYLRNINAPSSVDAVRDNMRKEELDILLGDISQDTNEKYGNEIMRRFGMGQFAPGIGATSDISANALARTAAEGARTAAGARTTYALQDLARLGEREAALRAAYGTRYGNAENRISAQAQRDNLYAQLLAGTATPEKPGLFEDILRNTNIGISYPIRSGN